MYLSRKRICRYKPICKKAELCRWPGLPKYLWWACPSWLLVSFWTSKTLYYISRREETIWSNQMELAKASGHSQGHNCQTVHIPCQTLTRTIIQKQPVSQHRLQVLFPGWWQPVHTSSLPWKFLLLPDLVTATLGLIPRSPVTSPRVPPNYFKAHFHPFFSHLYHPRWLSTAHGYHLVFYWASFSYWFVSILCILKELVPYWPHSLKLFFLVCASWLLIV